MIESVLTAISGRHFAMRLQVRGCCTKQKHQNFSFQVGLQITYRYFQVFRFDAMRTAYITVRTSYHYALYINKFIYIYIQIYIHIYHIVTAIRSPSISPLSLMATWNCNICNFHQPYPHDIPHNHTHYIILVTPMNSPWIPHEFPILHQPSTGKISAKHISDQTGRVHPQALRCWTPGVEQKQLRSHWEILNMFECL